MKSSPSAVRLGTEKLLFVVRAWISAMIGLVPSITHVMQLPGLSAEAPSRSSILGFAIPNRPLSVISNMPISLVDP